MTMDDHGKACLKLAPRRSQASHHPVRRYPYLHFFFIPPVWVVQSKGKRAIVLVTTAMSAGCQIRSDVRGLGDGQFIRPGLWNVFRTEQRCAVNRYESQYSGRYKHWTPEDIAQLRRMAGKQESVTAIARRFNRSVGAIRTRAYAEGISLAQGNKTPSIGRATFKQVGRAENRPLEAI
ncbi:hypothetical protein [Mesorhizobium sp. YR577]|uniref:hypothetical protein n=1 Tax=Mesorhizobium sp. YR577 TaxID=1884373 RepID=UPI001114A988|nr:hypothetical protein [Mesorhizobium sp. YR577]